MKTEVYYVGQLNNLAHKDFADMGC